MTDEWHDRVLMVIPSINGGHLLERMLPTLRFKPANVIVLDQGSTDNTQRICAAAGVELMQLGQPRTYTESGNIGADIARQRGIPFLCLANNDIAFRTDVLAELLAEMDRDPRLGIVAPSQIILDPANDLDVLARRVFWNLQTLDFLHDAGDNPATPRIDADFCELTCALVRMTAVEEVGFLDDAFGFYQEDADFCFRLHQAGWGAAYLPRSQIQHYTSSTFGTKGQAQLDYLARNRAYFAQKHLGYGVRMADDHGAWPGEASVAARRLRPQLARFGLLDDARPDLFVGRVGPLTADYLLTTEIAPTILPAWQTRRASFRAVLAPSDAAVERFRSAGFTSFRAPLGIDTDIFHPWGASDPSLSCRDGELTYLAIATPNDDRTIAVVLQAWTRFATPGRAVRLIVAGTGPSLARLMGRRADTAYRSGHVEVSCYAAERVELRETGARLSDEAFAALYRSVDYTILAAAEGSTLVLAESLACGTPTVFDVVGSVAPLYRDVTGREIRPDEGGGLLAALEHSAGLSGDDRIALAATGRYGVLGHATLRHTVMAVRHALEKTQERKPGPAAGLTALAGEAGNVPSVLRLRSRLSSAAGRRFRSAATSAAQFGTVWQERGLPAAVSLSAKRLKHLAQQRRPAGQPPVMAAPTRSASARQPSPLLIGYIDAQLGIGQSLRGLAAALATAGAPFGIYPFGVGVEGRRSVPFMTERYDETTSHDVNIIEVSPAELPRVFAHVSADHFAGSYNILRTYWELARGPAVWREGHGMDRIHEIWAPNAFCAEAFRDFFDGPIVVVPPCLEIAAPSPAEPSRFGLDPDVFHFMFSFDYYSFPERKNPLAVVRAFLAAFPEPGRRVGLVVKATGAVGHFPDIKKDILAAARADGRITIIDESLSRDDMLALMAAIDCYVSLHRSEGFGLGMAEALAMEKPVIATGYSGNAEFVTEQTGFPIPFTLKPVRPHEYVHTGGQVWADPDERACAAAMRRVVDDPAEATARAKVGRAFVEERYGASNVGRLAAERLAIIHATRPPITA